MKITKNVGTIDSFFRIMLGFIGLAWGTSRMVHRPYRTGPFLIVMLSAQKLAEGITRFCPMLLMFGVSSENMSLRNRQNKSGESTENTTASPEKTAESDKASQEQVQH